MELSIVSVSLTIQDILRPYETQAGLSWNNYSFKFSKHRWFYFPTLILTFIPR